jgi:hypothetical protein
MKQQYLIYSLIAVIVIVFFAWKKLKNQKPQPDTDIRRLPENIFPTSKVANDKLVIVEGASENDINKILQEFCNSYNKKKYQAIPKLIKLSDRKFAITFPYDIDFEIYCYFINYVNYPMGFNKHFKTIGWATTKPTDTWMTEKSANKNVMLFVSEFDTEYDNVFLTTSDNIGYKLGFAMDEEKQPLNSPGKKYVKPPITVNELETNESIDFK